MFVSTNTQETTISGLYISVHSFEKKMKIEHGDTYNWYDITSSVILSQIHFELLKMVFIFNALASRYKGTAWWFKKYEVLYGTKHF